jgi:uncharacterized membrane protein YcfT
MMHSVLGVEKAVGAEGWMHYLVAFATPYRMPDFFLISGLFLARVIDRDWRTYLDRKVVHFGYFYVLWLTIQFGFKAPAIVADAGVAEAARLYLLSFIDPFGTLWFIYALPVFCVAAKLLRRVPWWIVWIAGAALETAHIQTGWTLIDEFAARFVYFYSGYVFAPFVFRLVQRVLDRPWAAAAALTAWAAMEAAAVWSGLSTMPGITLLLGFAGAVAVSAISALLTNSNLLTPVRDCGRHSLTIYLAFFLPMAATRVLLIQSGLIADIGTMSLIVTAVAVVAPLILMRLVQGTPLRFLFERPAWVRLPSPFRRLVPAE